MSAHKKQKLAVYPAHDGITTFETPYTIFQTAVEQHLLRLTNQFAATRRQQLTDGAPFRAVAKEDMDELVVRFWDALPRLLPVKETANESPAAKVRREDMSKSRLEFMRSSLSSSLVGVASSSAYPGADSSLFLGDLDAKNALLVDVLDFSLTCVEQEHANPDAALLAIEDVLETANVEEAERIFDYSESRVARLTKGMQPERGPSLVFLRMHNNLLRRLSKSLQTVFCGRILAFLASVFPISERSGVNLRGQFNSGNITVFEKLEEPEHMDVDSSVVDPGQVKATSEEIVENEDTTMGDNAENEEAKRVKAQADAEAAAKAAEESQRQFYTTFWSLQTILSNPPNLFLGYRPPPPPPAQPPPRGPRSTTIATPTVKLPDPVADPSTSNLLALRDGITKTLEVFELTTKRELELKGKGKEELTNSNNHEKVVVPGDSSFDIEIVKSNYFFPKFLTKRNLLELETADPYFRRQVLTQFLIVLGYIRSFSLDDRNLRAAQSKATRIIEPLYVYESRDELWVKPLLGQVWREIDATPPNGPLFARTIQQIIKRDQNWILWKAASCQSFEKKSLGKSQQDLAMKGFKILTSPPTKFPHQVGTAALTKLWSNKVTKENIDLMDPLKKVPDLNTFYSLIQEQNSKIEERKMDLELEGKSIDVESLKKDSIIQDIEERKNALSWRAFRVAQTTHLQFFQNIGLGDFEAFMNSIKQSEELKKNRIVTNNNSNNSVQQIKEVESNTCSNTTTPNLLLHTSNSIELEDDEEEVGRNGGGGGGQDFDIDGEQIDIDLNGEVIDDTR